MGERFNVWFNDRFESFLRVYDRMVGAALRRPWLTVGLCGASFVASLALFPRLGLSFFPRTDAGMFVINVKAPSGSRISVTEAEVAKVEALIRQIIPPSDLERDSFEYRCHARLFLDLYEQFGPAHRLCAGGPQR